MPGCNKLYKCGSQKIRKQCTFVAGRLKTAVLLQKPWFTAFLSRMSRKTQHTRFEDRILRKLANEDKPQIVPPCNYSNQIDVKEAKCPNCDGVFTPHHQCWTLSETIIFGQSRVWYQCRRSFRLLRKCARFLAAAFWYCTLLSDWVKHFRKKPRF